MYMARDTQLGISRVFVNYLSIICQRRVFFLKKDESFLFDNCERWFYVGDVDVMRGGERV